MCCFTLCCWPSAFLYFFFALLFSLFSSRIICLTNGMNCAFQLNQRVVILAELLSSSTVLLLLSDSTLWHKHNQQIDLSFCSIRCGRLFGDRMENAFGHIFKFCNFHHITLVSLIHPTRQMVPFLIDSIVFWNMCLDKFASMMMLLLLLLPVANCWVLFSFQCSTSIDDLDFIRGGFRAVCAVCARLFLSFERFCQHFNEIRRNAWMRCIHIEWRRRKGRMYVKRKLPPVASFGNEFFSPPIVHVCCHRPFGTSHR